MSESSKDETGTAFFGVYKAVDVSTYSAIYPSNPNPHIKEIATLYTELIRQFVQMRYLNAEDIHFAPHTEPRINLTQPAKYGFTKDVVDLYQMIPYVTADTNWNYGSDNGEFIKGGEFMQDLRGEDADWEQQTIDPTYGIDDLFWELRNGNHKQSSWDDENGPYIKPWYAVLSSCGNHGSLMILDTKTRRSKILKSNIWLVWQLEDSSDPVFAEAGRRPFTSPKTTNRNDLAQYPNRRATEFLRDMIKRFETLEWLPGGLYSPEMREYNELKKIYFLSGWPDAFNTAEFDRLRQESEKAEEGFRSQTQPLDDLEMIRQDVERRTESKAAVQRLEIQLEISEAAYAQSGSEEDKAQVEGQRETLENWRRSFHQISPEQWERSQLQIHQQLDDIKEEKRLLDSREGRFAGLTDEEDEQIHAEQYYESLIKRLEASLADKDQSAREQRMETEARQKAKEVPQQIVERWIEEQVKWGQKGHSWREDWKKWYEAKS